MKTPEQEAVLRSIRKLIDFWRISPEELEFEASSMPPVLPEVVPPSGPKYRHPVSGDTWDGRGPQPEWLKEALTRGGYTVEELRCRGLESSRLEH